MSCTPRFVRRLGALAAVAAIVAAVSVPLTASATPSSRGPAARGAAATGVVYGGRTPQGWPVVIELSKNHRLVVETLMGFDLPCATGGFKSYSDRYVNLKVSRKRKFRFSFSGDTVRYDDGTTADFEGSISGTLNRARTKISGRSRLKVTDYTNTGAVEDTCDSGTVRWTAKQ